jgi:2-polyprenyl-3-methyl-5-hydroxy-6-metoxy-1,4-benzoquinol methylase
MSKEVIANLKKQIFDLHTQVSSLKDLVSSIEFSDYNVNQNTILMAIRDKSWPQAVEPALICDPNNETEKLERSRGIIEVYLDDPIKDKKVLDFGCGDGHLVAVGSEFGTKTIIGYDINSNKSWEGFKLSESQKLTTSWDDVVANAPYDFVVAFDVLDHLENDSIVDCLNKIKSVMHPQSKLHIRFHPYTSRHATHLYQNVNKAFVHLFMSEDEIKQNFPEATPIKSIKITKPLATYEKNIQESGLKVVNRREITENVEDFFTKDDKARIIMKHLNFDAFPKFQLSLCFVDYVLKL